MKLSSTQQEIILLMRTKEWELVSRRYSYTSKRGAVFNTIDRKEEKKITLKTLHLLEEKGLIELDTAKGIVQDRYYKLTEVGKNLKLT